jgi:hypothetical protein
LWTHVIFKMADSCHGNESLSDKSFMTKVMACAVLVFDMTAFKHASNVTYACVPFILFDLFYKCTEAGC